MNLLFFSPYYLPYRSGLTLLPHRLLQSLPKTWKITILTFRHDSSLPSTQTQDSLTVIRMPYLFRLSKGFISLSSLQFFYRHLSKADLVLLNLPSAESLPLAVLAKIKNKPLLSFFHCHVSLKDNLFNRLISTALSLLVQIQLKLSQKVFITSHDYLQSLPYKKLFDRKGVEITPPVTPPSIDQTFAKQLQAQKKSQIWIGYVGRLAREKGLDSLLQAISRLKPKAYHLILAGPSIKSVVGETDYAQTFISKLKKSTIPFIHFSDLSDSKLHALYQNLDVLVLPSTNPTEAFGMVQAEAMSHQVPVIASNLPGIRVSINQTGMGLVVPPNDPVELSRAIETIATRRHKYCNPKTQKSFHQFFNQERTYDLFQTTLQQAGS